MFENIIASNLRKPDGIAGRIIARLLKRNLIEYDELEKHIDFKEGMNVLEIGYGPGYGIRQFAEKYDIHIDGIDFSGLMYKKASALNRKFIESGRVRLVCDNFSSRTFEKDLYERVYLVNVIYFWEDLKKNFISIKKVLKTGGMLVVCMAEPELLIRSKVGMTSFFNRHSIDDVLTALRNEGFNDVKKILHSKEDGCWYITASVN